MREDKILIFLLLDSHCRFEGVVGFYKGLKASLIRVVPACMITFLVYENVSHFMLARSKRLKEIENIKKEPA